MYDFVKVCIALFSPKDFSRRYIDHPIITEIVSYFPQISFAIACAFLQHVFTSDGIIHKIVLIGILLLCLWTWINVIKARREYHKAQHNSALYEDKLIAKINMKNELILVIQELVTDKMNRFIKALEELKNNGKDFFLYITQPEKQRTLALQKMYLFFFNKLQKREIDRKTQDERQVITNISILEPNDDFYSLSFKDSFYPVKSADIEENKEKFHYGETAAGKAWETGKLIIVSDIEADLKSDDPICAQLRDHDENIGSLACYPVFRDNSKEQDKLLFIINLYCNIPNYFGVRFEESDLELYVESFAQRLKLEYTLLELKKLYNEKGR